MYNLYKYMSNNEYKYCMRIHELEEELKGEQGKIKMFNDFLIEMLEKEKIQKENCYLKEQLFKLSKDPKYKTYYP